MCPPCRMTALGCQSPRPKAHSCFPAGKQTGISGGHRLDGLTMFLQLCQRGPGSSNAHSAPTALWAWAMPLWVCEKAPRGTGPGASAGLPEGACPQRVVGRSPGGPAGPRPEPHGQGGAPPGSPRPQPQCQVLPEGNTSEGGSQPALGPVLWTPLGSGGQGLGRATVRGSGPDPLAACPGLQCPEPLRRLCPAWAWPAARGSRASLLSFLPSLAQGGQSKTQGCGQWSRSLWSQGAPWGALGVQARRGEGWGRDACRPGRRAKAGVGVTCRR